MTTPLYEIWFAGERDTANNPLQTVTTVDELHLSLEALADLFGVVSLDVFYDGHPFAQVSLRAGERAQIPAPRPSTEPIWDFDQVDPGPCSGAPENTAKIPSFSDLRAAHPNWSSQQIRNYRKALRSRKIRGGDATRISAG